MRRERGAALFVVLIVLASLLIAAAALVRSSALASDIAGNVALKQAATEIADTGVLAAQNLVEGLADPDANSTNYYATMQPVDRYGIPQIDWSSVPVYLTRNGLSVQYVVERICNGPLPVANVQEQCAVYLTTQAGSNNAGAPTYQALPAVYYRATVRVTGPKSLQTFVQALFSR